MTRKRLFWALAAVAVAAVVVVLAVFQPQKLFIDKRVDEAAPALAAAAPVQPAAVSSSASVALPATSSPGPAAATATAAPPSVAAPSTATASPAGAAPAARAGTFRGLAHPAQGTATLLPAAGGTVVRLENFEVENGPDLFVYLSEAPADAKASAFDDQFVSLGRLKGNQGNQNYEIPAGVDLSKYKSVVVWCKRFKVGFAAAPLV